MDTYCLNNEYFKMAIKLGKTFFKGHETKFLQIKCQKYFFSCFAYDINLGCYDLESNYYYM